MAYLWKIDVVNSFSSSKLAKGMSAEVLIDGSTRQPSTQEAADALNKKYNCDAHPSTINNFIKISKG